MRNLKRFWPTTHDVGLMSLGALLQALAMRLFRPGST
jgi:hypothetical protein